MILPQYRLAGSTCPWNVYHPSVIDLRYFWPTMEATSPPLWPWTYLLQGLIA
ncbi:unnamed protein product, partial [Nesidiocoris tenuis]